MSTVRPEMLSGITLHADGTATLRTYDLDDLDPDTVATVFDLLGEPALVQLISADELADHGAAQRSVVVWRDDR